MAERRGAGAGRELTVTERLRAQIGLSPSGLIQLGFDPDEWKRWDRRYGPHFRIEHGCPLPGDGDRIDREPRPVGELPLPPGA